MGYKKPYLIAIFSFIAILVFYASHKSNKPAENVEDIEVEKTVDIPNKPLSDAYAPQPDDYWYRYNLEFEDKKIEVLYTAYEQYLPSEIRITSTQDLDGDRIFFYILEQVRKQYSEYIAGLAESCEPFCLEYAKWEQVDFNNWEWTKKNNAIVIKKRAEHLENIDLSGAVKNVLDRAEIIQFIPHNHGVLDIVEVLNLEKFDLIHFDSHSDFCLYNTPDQFINDHSDFINALFSKGVINNMYWVIPDIVKQDQLQPLFFSNNLEDSQTCYNQGPKDLVIYKNENRELFYEKPSDIDDIEYQEILVSKIFLEELDQIQFQHNIYLDFDFDYISNTGFDTIAGMNFNKTEPKVLNDLNKIFTTFGEAQIYPKWISFSESEWYVPPEDIQFLKQALQQLL